MSNTDIPIAVPESLFSYQAQTEDGRRVSGTIESSDAESALDRLRGMRLRVVEVAATAPAAAGRPIRPDDVQAFNQQLAQLTAAGLPVEQGLRLIATDMRRGRFRRTIEALAAEMEGGTPLDQAFEKYRGQFPPLYGRLVRAGVKSGNLSAVLLGLGRHLDLVQRLRTTLWRATAYPLFVLVLLGFLLAFLGMWVLPQFEQVYASFRINLPAITESLLALSHAAPVLLVLMLVIVVGGPILWGVLVRLGYSGRVIESLLLPAPLIGPVLRANLVARWCDAAKVGVDAGLDLPAAIELASDATASARLGADGKALIDALAGGRPLTSAQTRLLPATVPAAMQFASGFHDLGTTLGTLSEMYQRQAELRMAAIPGIVTPILVIVIAVLIGFVVLALMAPLLALIQGISGPGVFKKL